MIHHLTVLREAALIASDDDGATTYYTLRPATLDAVMAHLRRRLHLPGTANDG
ncbi:MAG: hypothetical protein NVSMB65_00440 [Chloroflexota bacterium]